MTNQFTELETIADEELMTAAGGIGFLPLVFTGVRAIGGAMARNPKATSQLVNGLADAVTSHGDLQNLEVR
tara:strand:+ start:297 stop:509 length:213 start_codon:yes stop_codon:yes gene_type:complete